MALTIGMNILILFGLCMEAHAAPLPPPPVFATTCIIAVGAFLTCLAFILPAYTNRLTPFVVGAFFASLLFSCVIDCFSGQWSLGGPLALILTYGPPFACLLLLPCVALWERTDRRLLPLSGIVWTFVVGWIMVLGFTMPDMSPRVPLGIILLMAGLVIMMILPQLGVVPILVGVSYILPLPREMGGWFLIWVIVLDMAAAGVCTLILIVRGINYLMGTGEAAPLTDGERY